MPGNSDSIAAVRAWAFFATFAAFLHDPCSEGFFLYSGFLCVSALKNCYGVLSSERAIATQLCACCCQTVIMRTGCGEIGLSSILPVSVSS